MSGKSIRAALAMAFASVVLAACSPLWVGGWTRRSR
jgi:hypothetical protein